MRLSASMQDYVLRLEKQLSVKAGMLEEAPVASLACEPPSR